MLEMLIVPEQKIIVNDLFNLSEKKIGTLTFGDTEVLRVGLVRPFKGNSSGERYWDPYDMTGATIKAGLGRPFTEPTAGTFTLTFGGNTTDPLAFDATDVQIAAELNGLASIASAGGVTVEGSAGYFTVIFTSPGSRATITIDGTNLVPESVASMVERIDGTGTISEVQTFRIMQEPAAYVSLSAEVSPPDAMTTDGIIAGGSGVNAVYRIEFSRDVYDGVWSVEVGASGAIPYVEYGATTDEVKAAFDALFDPVTVTVLEESSGSYVVTFSDTIDHGTMVGQTTGLRIIEWFEGNMVLQSHALESFLQEAVPVTLTFEVRGTISGGEVSTLYKEDVTVEAPVIDYRFVP